MLFGDDKMLLGLLEGDGEGEGDEAAMWDALGGKS